MLHRVAANTLLGCPDKSAGQASGGECKGGCRGSKQRTCVLTWQPCSWTLAALAADQLPDSFDAKASAAFTALAADHNPVL